VSPWHIITSEYPPDVGGVSDYTRQVAEGLARMGDEVHVWCPRASDGAGVRGLQVHPDLGSIRPRDLRRLDDLLAPFPSPRRLLVQWVPHGFGYHSMNVWFCLWLARRARRGDAIELMVHEPYLEFRRGPVRHALMACVHRVMTTVLLRAARTVWMSIPAWEGLLRPYALGRDIPMQWLPVPGCVAAEGAASAAAIRLKYVADEQHLLGHFGSYGEAVAALLFERLPLIMDGRFTPSLLLLGAGSDRFREALISRHPSWNARVHAAGYLSAPDLGAHIAACDLFLQPYPDGITSRRTSAMACLSRGRPVVTTSGHLTEPLWVDTRAVEIVEVGDSAAFASSVVSLLAHAHARTELGARGQQVYTERFSVTQIVKALRAAAFVHGASAPGVEPC
jgi:glycosyltransferase involved in cell wall biosynthesis